MSKKIEDMKLYLKAITNGKDGYFDPGILLALLEKIIEYLEELENEET